MNITGGLSVSPRNGMRFTLIVATLYALSAFAIGEYAGLFEYSLLQSKLAFLLPFTLFLFPAFLEEAFFRGLLIPRSLFSQGIWKKAIIIVLSAALFVAWHPFNAYFFNFGAQEFFFNPYFLTIVFLLGIACGMTYVASGSLWVPILIHWLTVVVWVFFLGGRNLVKEVGV